MCILCTFARWQFIIFFLVISGRTIISRSAGPIFAIFLPNESVLGAYDRSGPLFDISRAVAMATDFVEKMANSALSLLWDPGTEWDITTSMCKITAQMMPLYRVKIL